MIFQTARILLVLQAVDGLRALAKLLVDPDDAHDDAFVDQLSQSRAGDVVQLF